MSEQEIMVAQPLDNEQLLENETKSVSVKSYKKKPINNISVTDFDKDEMRKFDEEHFKQYTFTELLKVLMVRGEDLNNPTLFHGSKLLLKQLHFEPNQSNQSKQSKQSKQLKQLKEPNLSKESNQPKQNKVRPNSKRNSGNRYKLKQPTNYRTVQESNTN